MIYAADLAYVHHAGFSEYARRTAPEIVGLLTRRRGFSRALRSGSLIVEFGCGGGTTAQLLRLAHEIQVGVRARFGVELTPEPVFVGDGWGASET